MERFAAMVAGRRAAPAPTPASAAEERKDDEYMRIQLEEIVIVKDDAYDALATATAAAHSRANNNANGQCGSSATTAAGTASTYVENCARAAAAAVRGGSSTTAAAAQGAWTAAARGVGFD